MKLTNCKSIEELEDVYQLEKKRIDKEMQDMNELKYQIRRENERKYELFLFMKEKMGYSNEASEKMLGILEEFEQELNHRMRHNEMKLESERDELKKEYVKRTESLGDGD